MTFPKMLPAVINLMGIASEEEKAGQPSGYRLREEEWVTNLLQLSPASYLGI